MTKPTIHPRGLWTDAAGQLGSEAQRIMRSLIALVWNRTGLETSAVVTGTAGTAGNLSAWNSDGDLVDANAAVGAMPDNTFRVVDNGDPTKKLAFEVSGVTTATTRTLTVPNASGTIALTSDLTSGYQPLDADLTSWAAITRASGFDTFVATPSSANFASLLTDETGTAGTVPFQLTGTWTPGVTPGTGSITTVGAVSGTYVRIGHYVLATATVAVTTNGTGASFLIITLPINSMSGPLWHGVGRNANTGAVLIVNVATSASVMTVVTTASAYPIASGETLTVTVVYRAA